ncbi:MAG: nitroreductase family protein [Opitutae bacterium]
MDQEKLTEIIQKRRTRKPASFHSAVPRDTITRIIDKARHAPNHHRTEPARFYLLNREKITQLAQLMAETIQGDGHNSVLSERAARKEKEWSQAPGLLVVTSFSDSNSALFSKNENLIEENYASTCCIIQNLLLLFEAHKISAKWSTAPVWKHTQFSKVIGLKRPMDEKFVGFLFYGYSDHDPINRKLSPLQNQLVDYSAPS